MPQQLTYKANVIVLRKRDLGESDLVLTLLADDGTRIEAVAKGARKPQNSQSARLELFSCAEVHLARGKSLDIAKESRVITSYQSIRDDFEKMACASIVAEAIDKTLVAGTDIPKLYPMTIAALNTLCACKTKTGPAVVAAHLMKLFAFHGLKPNLGSCVHCGRALDLSNDEYCLISYEEGGAICSNCKADVEAITLNGSTIAWAQTLLMATFSTIEELEVEPSTAYDVLQFCHQWLRCHAGVNLKSLNYLFAFCSFDQNCENVENNSRG